MAEEIRQREQSEARKRRVSEMRAAKGDVASPGDSSEIAEFRKRLAQRRSLCAVAVAGELACLWVVAAVLGNGAVAMMALWCFRTASNCLHPWPLAFV